MYNFKGQSIVLKRIKSAILNEQKRRRKIIKNEHIAAHIVEQNAFLKKKKTCYTNSIIILELIIDYTGGCEMYEKIQKVIFYVIMIYIFSKCYLMLSHFDKIFLSKHCLSLHCLSLHTLINPSYAACLIEFNTLLFDHNS